MSNDDNLIDVEDIKMETTHGTAKETLQKALVVSLEQARERRLIRNLAEGLMAYANIKEGIDAVALIGDGTEQSNKEAMIKWVTANRDVIDMANAEGQSPIFYLFEKLKYEIEKKLGCSCE
jgi:hypothetical protein